ncbi:MAG: class I SAM-dependent methyltransferase [Lachnospiraceae bacterium]|nr:class I SAM-dependent methyltransferase [Lachnospiraceae bacterium]
MYIADNWKDYEVLDTGNGEKLERWGKFILVRPDPQVIWQTDHRNPGWKNANGHYHRSSKGGGEWEFKGLPDEWSIGYAFKSMDYELTFNLKPFAFKHTGVFPEQAANWEWTSSIIKKEAEKRTEGDPVKVLNLFAYTGGATMAALAAGASVTHVDASKGMVGWARENAASSGLADRPVRWLVDDCGKFVEREIRRGNKYDAIIMDPPSYGRGPKGEIWKIEESIWPFLENCVKILSDRPLFFLINSYTTGLQAGVLDHMMGKLIVPKFGGSCGSDEVGLPVSGSGLYLPCGASGRWQA